MDLKSIFCLILVCLMHSCAFNLVNCLRYEYISDCRFNNKSATPGLDELTLICGEKNRENVVFDNSRTYCENYFRGVAYIWQGTVKFENCRLPRIKRNFFEMFKNMHTLDISNVELETMESDIFREATNVTTLYLSRNKLIEIPSHIFFNSKKLKFVDFSNNSINRIDPMAFEGATDLRTLNLSHNIVEVLDSRTLLLPKLLSLDLSYNNLTEFREHIFDNLTNLEQLDLSFNAVGNLDIKTFSYLIKLKNLNLKRTNLSTIQLGTLSQQHKLVSLDLSENRLTNLDFKLFLPMFGDLRSLYLGRNELKNLNGFRNAIFPQLSSLQIEGNHFSCAYLSDFMEMVDWEKIHLSSDENLIDKHKSNILGIGCDDAWIAADEEITIQNYATDSIEILLAFISVVLTLFLVLFTITNSSRIYDRCSDVLKFCQRIRKCTSKGNVVEFTNDLNQISIK